MPLCEMLFLLTKWCEPDAGPGHGCQRTGFLGEGVGGDQHAVRVGI